MATSGTTSFTLDISDIMEEAYDLAGLEMRSGYDYRSAKRSLDLIFLYQTTIYQISFCCCDGKRISVVTPRTNALSIFVLEIASNVDSPCLATSNQSIALDRYK